MKTNQFLIFLLTFLFFFTINVYGESTACLEIKYLSTEYLSLHKEDFLQKCLGDGFINENCRDIAYLAQTKYQTCLDSCGANDPDVLDSLCGGAYDDSPDGDPCYHYKCTTEYANQCARKCKYHLDFKFGDSDNIGEVSDNNTESENVDNDNIKNESDKNLLSNTNKKYYCIGEVLKNSKLCSGDDQNLINNTQLSLVEFCSVPSGSEPKCEYICNHGLENGNCNSEGFFRRIFNWFNFFK